MSRALARVLLPLLILSTILAVTLALAPLATGRAAVPPAALPHAQAPTPTPTGAAGESQPGSTDGLVVMSFVIAAIVVLPLMMQRNLWVQ